MNNRTKYILFAAFLLLLFSIAIALNISHIKNLHQDYELLNRDDQIAGKIINIKKKKGTSFITLKSKRLIIRSSENYEYNRESIVDNLFVGDSISKKSFNDTIYVFKKNKKMTFIHGKALNVTKE